MVYSAADQRVLHALERPDRVLEHLGHRHRDLYFLKSYSYDF